ncbi:FAD:protein FMN transferase [Phenylobacterium sp. J367]|uniref:FAD:protein FMN transferase n=1 Tax=Phenylobacterium sp. J367 TaxID=2898435 RepID=UPI002151B953|nr:FAD:protein FMN transferase [Phenylobacterium sp. J367]MCR5878679.1 FAD:protein FMN transferase [Phenylobacterium sp. J367]
MRIAVPTNLTPESARPRGGRRVRLAGPTMGVTWALDALAPEGLDDGRIRAAVQSACDGVVGQMSDWEPESDLSQFNRAEAGTWVPAPADLIAVVDASLRLAGLSGGAFDPTIGALTGLWGFGPSGAVDGPPDAGALDAAPAGWRSVLLDPDGQRIFQPGGLQLDLSGIAKGFGVDKASAALTAMGVRDHLIEIGGELRGEGVKGSGEPWFVDVERPPGGEALTPLRIALHGLSVATSGDWRRSFETGGRRYSHTIDPRTRAPAQGVAAVTVIHPSCMWADALCTALTVLGEEAGAFAEAYDVAALVVRREGEGFHEAVTPALRAMLA